ncbi:hypothetical protein [Vibrio bivalvicida]|uniref:Uncharacterized protein n=1 Tax=Vibrio bivalvicida TaxID=1276888 RepID=A0ABV4MM63_9VIBR
MTISARVDEAITKLVAKDFENSLVQLSIAVDATGKRKCSNDGVGKRCKKFILEHEAFIHFIGLNGMLSSTASPMITYANKGDFGQVFYNSIRCALLHEADVSKSIHFVEGPTIGMHDGKVIINDYLLWGLIFSIIGDGANSTEKMANSHQINYHGTELKLNEVWGKIGEIHRITRFSS